MALGFTRAMPLALACMFGIGAGAISMAAMANTTIQLNVPDVLRGRVLAVYAMVFAGSTPIGGLAFGALAAAVGAALAITIGGAIALLVAILGGVWAWRRGLLVPLPSDAGSPAPPRRVPPRASSRARRPARRRSPAAAVAVSLSADGLAEDRP